MATLKYFKVRGINDRNSKQLRDYNKNIPNRNSYVVPNPIRETEPMLVDVDKMYNEVHVNLFAPIIWMFKLCFLPFFLIFWSFAAMCSGLEYIFGINSYKEITFFEDIGKWGFKDYYLSKENSPTRKKGYAFKVFLITLILYIALTSVGFMITKAPQSKLFMSYAIGAAACVIIIPILFAKYKITNKKIYLDNGMSAFNSAADKIVDRVYINTKEYVYNLIKGDDKSAPKSKPKEHKKNSYRNTDIDRTHWCIDDFQIIKKNLHRTVGWFYTDTAFYEIDKDQYKKEDC